MNYLKLLMKFTFIYLDPTLQYLIAILIYFYLQIISQRHRDNLNI